MFTAASKYDTSFLRIRVDFTQSGRRYFHRINARLGDAFIRFPQLALDLAEYIERHIDSGNPMTAEFDVCYEGGICLTVYCSGGTYYIKEVTNIGTVVAVKAVLVWVQFKRGCDYLLRQVLACWRLITVPMEPAVCCL